MKRIILCVVCLSLVVCCGCTDTNVSNSSELLPLETTAPTEATEIVTEAVGTVADSTERVEEIPPYLEYEYFREEVDYAVEYISNGEVIPHLLLEPSTAPDYEKLPLVIWLHGTGEKNSAVDEFRLNSLRKTIAIAGFTGLEGMNAYLVAPYLVQGDFWSPFWCTETSANNIQDLVDYYVENYNVDPRQVVVSGHSLGGQGAVYMPQVLPDTFCAMVPISAYNPTVPLTNTEIPVWCFEGDPQYGEASTSYEYAMWDFARVYGPDSVTVLPTGHGGIPREALLMDRDNNMRSDVMEWMAEQMAKNLQKDNDKSD